MFTYEAKSCVFSKLEQQAYQIISSALPDDYRVLPHAPVGSFVTQLHSNEHHHILTHSCAFLILNKHLKPVLVAEWKDEPDAPKSEVEHHRYVARAYEECGLPLLLLQEEHLNNPDVLIDELRGMVEAGPIARVERFSSGRASIPQDGKEYNFVANGKGKRRIHRSRLCWRLVGLAWFLLGFSALSFCFLALWLGFIGLFNSRLLVIPYGSALAATLASIYPFRYRKHKKTLIIGIITFFVLVMISTFKWGSIGIR